VDDAMAVDGDVGVGLRRSAIRVPFVPGTKRSGTLVIYRIVAKSKWRAARFSLAHAATWDDAESHNGRPWEVFGLISSLIANPLGGSP